MCESSGARVFRACFRKRAGFWPASISSGSTTPCSTELRTLIRAISDRWTRSTSRLPQAWEMTWRRWLRTTIDCWLQQVRLGCRPRRPPDNGCAEPPMRMFWPRRVHRDDLIGSFCAKRAECQLATIGALGFSNRRRRDDRLACRERPRPLASFLSGCSRRARDPRVRGNLGRASDSRRVVVAGHRRRTHAGQADGHFRAAGVARCGQRRAHVQGAGLPSRVRGAQESRGRYFSLHRTSPTGRSAASFAIPTDTCWRSVSPKPGRPRCGERRAGAGRSPQSLGLTPRRLQWLSPRAASRSPRAAPGRTGSRWPPPTRETMRALGRPGRCPHG